MSAQPKALRLADALQDYISPINHATKCIDAAAELRRLHEVNAELLEALKAISKCCPYIEDGEDTAVLIALGTKDEVRAMRAVIAKAEGGAA